jgi:hypothetical protein
MRRDNHVATTVLIPVQFLCSPFGLWVIRDRGFQAHGFLVLLMRRDNNVPTKVLIPVQFLCTLNSTINTATTVFIPVQILFSPS